MQATVEDRNLFRHMAKVKQQIAEGGRGTIYQMTEAGKQYARTIAPHGSGRTASFIEAWKRKTKNGYEGRVIARNPGNSNRIGGGSFNLVRWMHETGGIFQTKNTIALRLTKGRSGEAGTAHIFSGNPRFMYATHDYLERNKANIVKSEFNKIKIQ